MSLISNLLPQGESSVPMDDNAAQTNAAENPYLAIAVPQIQAAFDTMYEAVHRLVEGKNASLKQIDKWLEKWEKRLEYIAKKYEELLGKFDDLSDSLDAALTLDVAKEAWELIQDLPILRRYLGEANYWLLYDTVGLAATQGSAVSADLATAVKATLKAGIKALLAMTEGMMSIESYLGMISQYWGALYIKMLPLPLIDSVVPNVTCTYFFKHEMPSEDPAVDNPAPSLSGFLPIPAPIPNPEYVARYPLRSLAMDYNDPETWMDPESGLPKFLNTDALYAALEYWGSSYFNETIPGVTSADPTITAVYKRRAYVRDEEQGSEAHPLRVGNTFAQLDVSKTIVAYGGNAGGNSTDNEKALLVFKELWADEQFQAAMREWQGAWDTAREGMVTLMKSILDGYVPVLGENGDVVIVDGEPLLGEFVSLSQIDLRAGGVRQEAYDRLMSRLFTGTTVQGLRDLSDDTYALLGPLTQATRRLIREYLAVTGQPAHLPGVPDSQYILSKSYSLAALVAKAALAMRLTVPQSSKYFSNVEAIPLFGKCKTRDDGTISWSSGLSQFVRVFAFSQLPRNPEDDGRPLPEGVHLYTLGSVTGWWRTDDPSNTWSSIPTFDEDDPTMSWGAWMCSLVCPTILHPMPYEFYKDDGGNILRYADPLTDVDVIGTTDKGAFSVPSAWGNYTSGYTYQTHVTCGFFVADDITDAPTTTIGAIITMLDESAVSDNALEDEIADAVGYSVLKGRRPLAACFGIYGRLLGMEGWCFKAMPAAPVAATSPTYNAALAPAETFADKYTRIPGSDLWYETDYPDHIVYKHSTFYSPSRGMPYTIYHEYMATESHDRGNDHYDFYVFPTESISVQELHDTSLGALRSVDATGADGRKWHYIVMKNAVPKCPKYVEASYWSIIDIIHELYLLAWGMSPFCGDNGERLAKLEDILKQLGVTEPQFIGQLPGDGEDTAANFQIKLFETYASRIERLVSSVYTLRDRILAATDAW